MIRAALKFSVLVSLIFIYMGHAIGVRLRHRDRWQAKDKLIHLISAYSRLGLRLLGIRVTRREHDLATGSEANALIVGNHLSYLDILVIASQKPTCFVTSQEIRETPVLGQLCELAGCLFVERRNKENLLNEIREITEALERGLNVVIFPEATSTNGEQVIRFRRPLFAAAVEASRQIQPICLNYRMLDGEPVTVRNRDQIFWYGDMGFPGHLWQLTQSNSIEVDLHILHPLVPETGSEDPTDLANTSHSIVTQVYRPIVAL